MSLAFCGIFLDFPCGLLFLRLFFLMCLCFLLFSPIVPYFLFLSSLFVVCCINCFLFLFFLYSLIACSFCCPLFSLALLVFISLFHSIVISFFSFDPPCFFGVRSHIVRCGLVFTTCSYLVLAFSCFCSICFLVFLCF